MSSLIGCVDDLFVLQEDVDGKFGAFDFSVTRRPGATEQLGGPEVVILPAGVFYIAVGAFSGAGQYSLELRQGAGAQISFVAPSSLKIRHMALVDKRKR